MQCLQTSAIIIDTLIQYGLYAKQINNIIYLINTNTHTGIHSLYRIQIVYQNNVPKFKFCHATCIPFPSFILQIFQTYQTRKQSNNEKLSFMHLLKLNVVQLLAKLFKNNWHFWRRYEYIELYMINQLIKL